MSFDVAAESYTRFMGRFSEPLAPLLADLAGVREGLRVLDVGCGPGALTAELVSRVGESAVAAIDPSESFISALTARFPGVEAHRGVAESLPFPDAAFDATLAQLVVHFMADPVGGLAEMARVTRRGGAVAACVWDHAGGLGPLSTFWQAAHELDPTGPRESDLPGTRDGHLAELVAAAGLTDVRRSSLTVTVRLPDVEAWWQPFLLGVGPAGAYVRTLEPSAVAALRDRCAELLPAGAFSTQATAWAVVGRA